MKNFELGREQLELDHWMGARRSLAALTALHKFVFPIEKFHQKRYLFSTWLWLQCINSFCGALVLNFYIFISVQYRIISIWKIFDCIMRYVNVEVNIIKSNRVENPKPAYPYKRDWFRPVRITGKHGVVNASSVRMEKSTFASHIHTRRSFAESRTYLGLQTMRPGFYRAILSTI